MTNFTQITAVLFGLAMSGTAVLAENNRENYVEVDPAPSGIEMQEVFVGNDTILGMPGRDSGIVYDGGFTASGQQRTVFDFSNGVGGGGGGLDDLRDSTILYEQY